MWIINLREFFYNSWIFDWINKNVYVDVKNNID